MCLADYTYDEIDLILQTASELKAGWQTGYRPKPLSEKSIAVIFNKPSTRTRTSFEVGIYQLGGHALIMDGKAMHWGTGSETIEDTAGVLSRMVSGIVIRTFAQTEIERLARAATVPVINALTDASHPMQILADLLTLKEQFGRLQGFSLTYVGDANNVTSSLLLAAATMGFSMKVASPEGYEVDHEIRALVAEKAKKTGSVISYLNDPKEAIVDANVLYTDTWISMGQEEEAVRRRRDFQGFTVAKDWFKLMAKDAIFMHDMPAHRGEEVTAEVLEGERSVILEQAENRLHAQKAVLMHLIGGED